MIESIEFTNFKALRKTTLPLAPFTLLLGPNGSGKSSVLQALQLITACSLVKAKPDGVVGSGFNVSTLKSVTVGETNSAVQTKFNLLFGANRLELGQTWRADGIVLRHPPIESHGWSFLSRMKTFALDAIAIAQFNQISADPLQSSGQGLAAVLDSVRDDGVRWNSLIAEMSTWLPEYDNIEFDRPAAGQKGIVLRTKKGQHRIPARELSQGTLVALALLTLAYLPDPPTVIGLEEIDRGLHPRLLRHLQDALYRLSYPESLGEKRAPIQVIATTHSPYLLDLYRDHPKEVVLAQKEGLEVQFKRLTDIDHYEEIMGDSPLSEVWYSGVLGGVAVKP